MKPNSTTVYVNEYNTKDADQCRVDIFIRKDTSSPYVLLCNTLVNFTPTDAATLYNISIINSPPILTEGCESHYRADVINNSNQMISAQDIELWCYQYIPLSDKWVPVGWRSIDGFLPNQTKSVDLLFFGRDLRANKLKSNLKINNQKVSESSPQTISPVPITLQIKNVQVTRQSGIVNWSAVIQNNTSNSLCRIRIKSYTRSSNGNWCCGAGILGRSPARCRCRSCRPPGGSAPVVRQSHAGRPDVRRPVL